MNVVVAGTIRIICILNMHINGRFRLSGGGGGGEMHNPEISLTIYKLKRDR